MKANHLLQCLTKVRENTKLDLLRYSMYWEATEDEMVEWHHRLDGCEFEQALGVGDGQGSLVCCSSWGGEESDTTEWLN